MNNTDALLALVAKWHKEADEIAANNWTCNSYSIRARADELEQALAAPAASVELIEAIRELRQRQRDYLSQPKGERIEAKGRLVGLAADRVDAALALIDSAGGAKGDMTECGHSKYDPCHNCEPVNTPQPAESDGAVGSFVISEASEGEAWIDLLHLNDAGRKLGVGEHAIYTRPAATAAVDDAMVERALAAYAQSRGTYEGEGPTDADDMRAALTAALAQQEPHHD